MSILNQKISLYPSRWEVNKGIVVNLLDLLHENKYAKIIQQLRSEDDEEKQAKLKASLPCYTVSGTFSTRCNSGLLIPSGLAAVDLDSAEDYDVLELGKELMKLDCIAYCGLSCRGKRLFCIIPFATSDYVNHYDCLIKSFEDIDLPIGDTCHKTISQARYVSSNTEQTHWFNHSAKPYSNIAKKRKYYFAEKETCIYTSVNDKFYWCVEQINKSHSFVVGNRHKYIVMLARYCNLKGLPEEITMTGCMAFVEETFQDKEIKRIIKGIYNAQIGSHGKYPFNK